MEDKSSGAGTAESASLNTELKRKKTRGSFMQRYSYWVWAGSIAGTIGFSICAVDMLHAEAILPVQRPLGSLKTIPVPGPSAAQLAELIVDKQAAIQLGKALFWDTRVGSDSRTACASCHFHSGADNRITNQINPGVLSNDVTFQLGGPKAGPNYTLTLSDFPLTKHSDVNDAATLISDINDVVSSQGVFTEAYDRIMPLGRADGCTSVSDIVSHGGSGFAMNGRNTRRVEPRNTPTVINAAYNFRNFWDGRGNNMFNGGDPFGMRNADALVYKVEQGVMRRVPVTLGFSSLASQASGPPMSGNEMSCAGRAFINLGKKLLGQKILANQVVAPGDSVLGGFSTTRPLYSELIAKAFRPEYWTAAVPIDVTADDLSKFKKMDLFTPRDRDDKVIVPPHAIVNHMEANFSLFFALAVQLYEQTLIADDTPFDQFAAGNHGALNPQQVRGLAIFQEQGRCVTCHSGPELTGAAISNVFHQRVERMVMGDGNVGIYDTGFYNIGVRPTTDDLGLGGNDPFGNPLSETRMMAAGKAALLGDGFSAGSGFPTGQRIVADGTFKTPSLRNVEFTGPYFHNGGKATLMQVVDFYNRGSDFGKTNIKDFDFSLKPLGLTENQKQDLVSFLLSLSDERVRYSQAPFDHPSICVPNGHVPSNLWLHDGSRTAPDIMECLPAVGKEGSIEGLATFLGADPFSH